MSGGTPARMRHAPYLSAFRLEERKLGRPWPVYPWGRGHAQRAAAPGPAAAVFVGAFLETRCATTTVDLASGRKDGAGLNWPHRRSETSRHERRDN
jgi:hypothetical protein